MSNILRRRGFTLIEVVAVIAITAILIAILLPAIQAARESSRATTCRNNLHQIGIALHTYHDSNRTFPPSIQMAIYFSFQATRGGTTGGLGKSWVIALMPHLEEQNLLASLKLNFTSTPNGIAPPGTNLLSYNAGTGQPWNGSSVQELASGATLRGTAVSMPTLLCPSDKYNDTKWQLFIGTNTFNPPPNQYQLFARTNYAANACDTWPYAYSSSPIATACGGPDQPGWATTSNWSWRTRGVMGANASVSFAGIKDGTTKTLLIAEIRAGLHQNDARGVWAQGGATSSLWSHGMVSINDCNDSEADYMAGAGSLALSGLPGATSQARHDYAARECMPIGGENDNSVGVSSSRVRSTHPGGVNVCMADGRVVFLSELIEHGDLSGNWPSTDFYSDAAVLPHFLTWERLIASADGLPIDESKLEP